MFFIFYPNNVVLSIGVAHFSYRRVGHHLHYNYIDISSCGINIPYVRKINGKTIKKRLTGKILTFGDTPKWISITMSRNNGYQHMTKAKPVMTNSLARWSASCVISCTVHAEGFLGAPPRLPVDEEATPPTPPISPPSSAAPPPLPAQRDGVADQHGDSVGTVPLDLRVEAAEEVAQPHETDGDDGDPHDIRHIARHAPKLEGAAGAGKVVWNGGKGKGWRKEQRIEDKGRRKEQRIEDEMV